MALDTNELFRSNSRDPLLRMDASENGTKVATFAAAAGAPVYPPGTALVNDAGVYRPWLDADLIVLPIAGFVWQVEVQTDAVNQVQGVILLRGQIHFDDIPPFTGQTPATLTTALKEGPRELGLDIQGLPGSGGHFDE